MRLRELLSRVADRVFGPKPYKSQPPPTKKVDALNHHPVMQQALNNAPTLFENARRLDKLMAERAGGAISTPSPTPAPVPVSEPIGPTITRDKTSVAAGYELALKFANARLICANVPMVTVNGVTNMPDTSGLSETELQEVKQLTQWFHDGFIAQQESAVTTPSLNRSSEAEQAPKSRLGVESLPE